jgi:acyl-coenzyme A synthetase/AMP-(fatty) acid ligase
VGNFVRDYLEAQPPDRPALRTISAEGQRRGYTFGELAAEAGSVAGLLAARGVRRGDVVLTLMGNRIEFALTMLACLRLGAAMLPCTEQLRPRDLQLRVRQARPVLIVCDERNRAAVGSLGCPVLDVPWTVPAADVPAPAELTDSDPAFVLFTSGTSGKPKLVTYAQRYIWGQRVQAEWWLGVRPGELFWSTAAPGWSKSTRNAFLAPWLGGASALLQDKRFNAAERLETIRAEGVNVLCMAPTEYRIIAADEPLTDLPSLRRIVAAGEAPGAAVVLEWQRQTGLRIADGYGQTETGHIAAARPGEDVPAGSMGRPLPGIEVSIVDGELVLDPSTVATFFLGYDGQPAPSGPWHTGDRVRQDENGYLFFESRMDDVIVSAGYRIGPEEVEAVLEEHPAVRECAVIGVPDEQRGAVVCAVIVATEAATASGTATVAASAELADELKAFVRERTAPYKYPRVIRFVDELPRTSSGKIIRAALRDASPASPEGGASGRGRTR